MKPSPAKTNPKANFAGLDGCLLFIRSHIHEKTGAKAIMKKELTDWNQLEGNSHPKMLLRVKRSAKRFKLDPACSNAIQKVVAKMNKTPMTSILLPSLRARSLSPCATTPVKYLRETASKPKKQAG